MPEPLIPITSWAAIFGLWSFQESGTAIYNAPQQRPEWPFGLCVSDLRFTEGEAHVTVQTSRGIDARIALGYRSPANEYFAAGIGGSGYAYTIAHLNPATGFREVAGAGREENLSVGRAYVISVRVQGQRIELSVDGIRVLEHVLEKPIPFGQLGLFSWGAGGVEFSNMAVRLERGRGEVFVVMQFAGFEELYTDVIVPVTQSFGLRSYRADEVYGPGNILADIVYGLETAQIIAEITPPNENVFYEVGYAHALKKPTILLADKTKKLPFDLTGYRCLFYENSIGGKRKVEEGLKKHLDAILHE